MATAPPKPLPMPVLNLRQATGIVLGWLLVNLVLLAPWWQPRWDGAGPAAPQIQVIGQADWRLVPEGQQAQQAQERQQAPAWQAVGLPHGPRVAAAGQAPEYRTSFSVTAQATGVQPLGICVPHGAWRAEVWLDGTPLRATAREWSSHGLWPWMRPHFIALPADLQAGVHPLRLRPQPMAGLATPLSEILVGPADAAQAVCDGLARPGLVDRLGGLLPALGLAALVVAWFMKDGAAFWFGMLAAGVQGGAWLLCPSQGPLSGGPWITAFLALHALLQIPLFFFVRSCAGVPGRRMVWIVLPAVAAQVLVALCMPAAWRTGWLVAVAGLWLLLGLWMAGALIGAGVSARVGRARQWLLLPVCLIPLAAAAQLLSCSGLAAVDVRWLPAAGLVWAASYLLLLVLQLIGAESQGRAAHADAARRLACERTALESAFEQRQQRQASEVQARERSRIMRELHDGLGSPLVAASALLSTTQPVNQAAADLIDLCLQELRGTIDALGADFRDVGELLGSFRDRMEPVLQARGIELDWQVQPLPATAGLAAGERLHVMRIVQEAFTNVLKHSGASQVIVRAETQASGCSVIDIIDNGRGFRPGTAQAPGWGLSNMHERAAMLGAQLSCTDGEAGGVHVRLALNCAPPEASPPRPTVFAGGMQHPRHA